LLRIKAERDETAERSLVLLLYYSQSDEADGYLRSISADSRKPKDERDFINMVLKHERELGIGKQPSHTREKELREKRRKRMFGLSDEAMDDLEELTRQIAQARTIPARNN
jgi:hypothetical protein